MHEKLASEGFAAVSVSLDPLPDDEKSKDVLKKDVLKFLRVQKASFTNLLLDESVEVWQKNLRFIAPPCYYVFSRQGKWTMFEPANDDNFDFKTVEKLVVELLREK